MSTTHDPQTSLYETEIQDADLEALLDERRELQLASRAAAKALKEKTAAAKDRIEKLDLGVDTPVRVGGFLITVKPVKPKTVKFETDATTRVQISLLPAA